MAGELFSMSNNGLSAADWYKADSTPASTPKGIDWRSIIAMLGNKPNQSMQQVPFQSLQAQYPGTNMTSQIAPTPAMFPDEQQQQTSAEELGGCEELISKLLAIL